MIENKNKITFLGLKPSQNNNIESLQNCKCSYEEEKYKAIVKWQPTQMKQIMVSVVLLLNSFIICVGFNKAQ